MQAPGQLFRGYYVSMSLIISKSLDKQEGINIQGFDPRFFVKLSSKAGPANCSKKPLSGLLLQGVAIFWSENRAGPEG